MEGSEWRHFGRVLLVAVGLPLLLGFGMLEWMAWGVGDTRPAAMAAAEQAQKADLVWMPASERKSARFKLARVAAEGPRS